MNIPPKAVQETKMTVAISRRHRALGLVKGLF